MSIVDRFIKTKNSDGIRTLFLVDILYMKDLNAIYGYENGDNIVSQLLKLLKTKVKTDIIKLLEQIGKQDRYIKIKNEYIDVFSIEIFDDLDDEYITHIVDIFLKDIMEHLFYVNRPRIELNLDITIGCSKSDDDRLIIYAEKALHNAKLNYLNYSFFDAKFFQYEMLDTSLIDTMKNNIELKKVEPYFQTILNNKTDTVYKYESLMRLIDEDGTVMTPYTFLLKAKKYRLYPKLMSIMIEKVLGYVQEYKISVSINFEYHDMIDPIIKAKFLDTIKEKDIGKYLTVEILESEKIQDFNIVREFIREIREYEVVVAIDDFGTGFSNYEHILELDIDYIKLDGSLIQKLNETTYYNLVKSIVVFCKKEDIKIVAEFVKDLATLRYVKSLDIDFSQGYYIDKPRTIQSIISENS
ncbi:MAG: EAL domain-containing protein [Campylobacterota bacterium]|nr:EAL domain-containing protein [Campylobacterota bacterium]